jgi:lipopolysaccharide export system permease protein
MTILDRYLIRQFTATFIFSILALCVIFLIVNLLESLDSFLDQKVGIAIIIQYYANFLPEIIKLLTPIGMLMAALFSIGRLSNLNEITAMKSGGMSLYRIMLPLFLVSLLITAAHLYFNGWIVPGSNMRKSAIERQHLKKGTANNTLYNVYLRDSTRRNMLMQFYDGVMRTGNGITIEEYDSEIQPRILHRYDAEIIKWDSIKGQWLLSHVYERIFPQDKALKVILHYHDSLHLQLSLRHDDIVRLQKSSTEMNFDEQRSYIRLLERGGKDVRMQMIDYYGQYAFPFANVIVILFAIPFASIRKKNGLAVEIATAMVVSFIYLACTKIGQNLGYSMNIDPALVGWLPNIIFSIAAIGNMIRIRT